MMELSEEQKIKFKQFLENYLKDNNLSKDVVNISAACKGKVRQAGGYQWNYEELPNIDKVRPKKIAEDLKTRYCKKIIALKDGEEVNRFNSVLEAGNFINKPHANVNISACALGKRKSAYGYQWMYI